MKKLVRNLLTLTTPKPAGKFVYALGLKLFQQQLRLKRVNCEVWPRHSYLLGPFVPFQSDLDLTIWMHEKFNPQTIATLRRTILVFGFIFPWMKDLNLFHTEEMTNFIPLINQYQLANDPLLSRKIQAKVDFAKFLENTRCQAEAATYLLRALDTDISHFENGHPARPDKWLAHFKRVAVSPPENLNIKSIAFVASRTAGLRVEQCAAVGDFYERVKANGNFQEVNPERLALIACAVPQAFPFFWTRDASAENLDFSKNELDLIRTQLSWEIFGRFSQIHLSPQTSDEHLSELEQAYEVISAGREDYVSVGFKTLRNLLKSSRS